MVSHALLGCPDGAAPFNPLTCTASCLMAQQHILLLTMCARLQATAELEARLAEVKAQHATLQRQLKEAQDHVTALETQLAEAKAAASGGDLQSAGGLKQPLFAQ